MTQPWKSLNFKEEFPIPTPLGMHVRAFFTYLLVAILLACPAMCRATEVTCCPGHEAEECSDEPDQQGPAAPSDADADSCICSGTALKADDSHATSARSTKRGYHSIIEEVLILEIDAGLGAVENVEHRLPNALLAGSGVGIRMCRTFISS